MSTYAIDFTKEVERLHQDTLIGKDSGIAIWGGECDVSRVPAFLHAWNVAMMPYHILEYAHRMTFTYGRPPASDELHLLERGRLFGLGGDVSLRRDGSTFFWHFIGPITTVRPSGFTVQDFWTESPEMMANPQFTLRQRNASALLWGDYKADRGHWHDDRVGWAVLRYPIFDPDVQQPEQRLWLHYSEFSDKGQVAFVWWKEIKRHG